MRVHNFRWLVLLGSLSLFLPSGGFETARAQDGSAKPKSTLQWVGLPSPTDGEILMRPSDFFAPNSPGFPETSTINTRNHAWLSQLVNGVEAEGMPIRLGMGNERSQFELYLPVVTSSQHTLPPNLGANRSTIQNAQYFPEHDLFHQLMGRPRYTPEELATPAARKKATERMIQTLLEKEVAATFHSAVHYTPEWYAYRDEQALKSIGRELHPDYRRLNTGWFATLNTTDKQVVADALTAFVKGDTRKYFTTLAKYMSAEHIEKLRKAGVAIAQPNMAHLLGNKGEAWANYIATALVEPIFSRYRSVGAKGFYEYSKAQAELMATPWFVEWTTRFKEGHTMDEIAVRVKDAMDKLIANQPVGRVNPVSSAEFAQQFTARQTSLFGRRIIEFRETGRTGRSAASFGAADEAEIAKILDETEALYHQVDQGKIATDQVQSRLAALMERAEKRFPVDVYFPVGKRIPDLTYRNYWRHPVSMSVPVYGHNTAGFNAAHMRRVEAGIKRPPKTNTLGYRISEVGRAIMRKVGVAQLDDDAYYRAVAMAHISDQEAAKVKVNPTGETNVYLRQNAETRQIIATQIHDVAVPKMLEMSHLTEAQRSAYIDEMIEFEALSSRLSEIDSDAYRTVFFKQPSGYFAVQGAPKMGEKEYHIFKKRALIGTDRGLASVFDVLRADPKNASTVLEKELKYLRSMNETMRAAIAGDLLREIPSRGAFQYYLDTSLPVRETRARGARTLAKMIGKGRFQKEPKFGEFLRNLDPTMWLRGGQKAIQYSGFNPASIKENGIYTFVFNHDYATFDPMGWLAETVQKAKLDDFYLLTTRVHYKPFGADALDPNVLYIEDNWKKQLLERISKNPGKKVGVFLYADGMVPFFHARPPLPAFSGSFRAQQAIVNAFAVPDEAGNRRRVFQVLGRTNALDHLSSEQKIPLTVDLLPPEELVPGQVTDEWREANRLRTEAFFNEYRRPNHVVDLIDPRFAPGTTVPVQADARTYLPYGEWLTESNLGRAASHEVEARAARTNAVAIESCTGGVAKAALNSVK